MAFREPRTPLTKTPGRRQTMDTGAPRASFAPGTASGALHRRSSVFHSTGTQGATHFKDKRNLILAPVKHANIVKIVGFLNGELTYDDVKNPTRKQFLEIFSYIYGTFHDNYDMPRSNEEQNAEIIKLLKGMGYPVTLKPSTLQTVNAPTSWPHMLGALSWMCEMAEYFSNVTLENQFYKEDGARNKALRYQADSAIATSFYASKRENMNEHDKEQLVESLIQSQVPKFAASVKAYCDAECRLEEGQLRCRQSREEILALEEEKRSDLCGFMQEEIKQIDADIVQMENFTSNIAKEAERVARRVEEKSRVLASLDEKIAAVNADIKSKHQRIDEQTQRTGLDSAAIRALAMEKESLLEQIRESTTELEKLSKFRYNIAPKANTAFIQEQAKFRRLLQRVYDVRAAYLDDAATPLLDALPGDIKSLLECLSSDVRRLFSKTKTELESRLKDVETKTRRLASDERRLHDELARVDKENREEEFAMEKEERMREAERAEWAREANLQEREKQSMEVERETLMGAQKEIGQINQMITEAELDLEETTRECTRKRATLDAETEARLMSLMEVGEELQNRRDAIERAVTKLERFNEQRKQQINA